MLSGGHGCNQRACQAAACQGHDIRDAEKVRLRAEQCMRRVEKMECVFACVCVGECVRVCEVMPMSNVQLAGRRALLQDACGCAGGQLQQPLFCRRAARAVANTFRVDSARVAQLWPSRVLSTAVRPLFAVFLCERVFV